MKQKTKQIVGAIMFAIAMFAVSCTSTTGVLTDGAKVDGIASILRTGTQITVSAVIAKSPDSKKYFTTVATGINAALGGKDLTPDIVINTINQHVKAIDADGVYYNMVLGAVDLALDAYRTFYEVNVEKSIQPYLVKLLKAIKSGVELGTVSGAPAPAGVNPISSLTKEQLTL